jgi:hypothetical protein
MTPSIPAVDPLIVESDSALQEFARLERRAAAFRTAPDEAERVALIDDLQAVERRLCAARDAMRALLHQDGTARAALSAYRRVGAIRPVAAATNASGRI